MNILPSCIFHAATRCAQVNEIYPSDCLVKVETGVNLTHYSLIDKEISEHFSWKLMKFVQKSLNFCSIFSNICITSLNLKAKNMKIVEI